MKSAQREWSGKKLKAARNKHLEEAFLWQVLQAKLLMPEREFRFHPTRKWRFDFAWQAKRIAVEIEGGIWINGAHVRGKHFESDSEKYNEAALLGWTVIRLTRATIDSGRGLHWLKLAMEGKGF